MDRRLYLVPGLCFLAIAIVEVAVVRWNAVLYTTAGIPTSIPLTTAALPAECAPVVDALASGRNVRIEGYQVWPAGTDTVIRERSVAGWWELGTANCADRLAFVDNLQVDSRSYRVEGRYRETPLHRSPLYGLLRVAGLMAGISTFFAGLIEIVEPDLDEDRDADRARR